MDVLLYGPQNPRNLGSIIRTSVEFGMPRIHVYDLFELLKKQRSLREMEHVCRSGRQNKIEIIPVTDPIDFVAKYKHPYATTLSKRSVKIGLAPNLKFEEDALLIFGSEANGLPREIARQHRINRVSIPNFGQENCLSLPVAYGIFVYEFLRQHPEMFPKRKRTH